MYKRQALYTKDTNVIDSHMLEARLQAEADAFRARGQRHKRYVIFDVEYRYDREGQRRADRHAAGARGCPDNDDGDPKFEVRWPFHRIGCIAAMALSVPTSGMPMVETLETWSRPEMTETEIVRAFSAFLGARSEAVPVTWGGEYKDLPAILSIAMREGLTLPIALAGAHWTHGRLDLCSLLTGKAKPPHLNEYAHAQGQPAKLMAPWELGEAAERGRWAAVREHCECDVTVTTMLLTRWLLTTGKLTGDRSAIEAAIVDAVARMRHYRPRLIEAIKTFGTPRLDLAA